jgi:hypothetical protein
MILTTFFVSITCNKLTKYNEKQKFFDDAKNNKPIVPTKRILLRTKAFSSLATVNYFLKSSSKLVVSSTERIKREFKSYFSSDFEVLLLRLTEPNDNEIDEKDISSFLATTKTFVQNLDLISNFNPYRVTLRKIWNKICENDLRTKLKALYVLHKLLENSLPEDAIIYKKLMFKMSRERNEKFPNTKYFDVDLNKQNKKFYFESNEKTIESFINFYLKFVLKRGKSFTSSFEELRNVDKKIRFEIVTTQVFFFFF